LVLKYYNSDNNVTSALVRRSVVPVYDVSMLLLTNRFPLHDFVQYLDDHLYILQFTTVQHRSEMRLVMLINNKVRITVHY
jgi:hypothetical protein